MTNENHLPILIETIEHHSKLQRIRLYEDNDGNVTYEIESFIDDSFEPHWTPVKMDSTSWFANIQLAHSELHLRHPDFFSLA